jgi:acyl-CoA dehydrogenase
MLTNPCKRYFSSYGTNHFTIDKPFQMTLEYCGLPAIHFERLTQLGRYASTVLLEITDYIDRFSRPHLQMWDINGRRFDWVRLNPAHRQALADLMKTGIIYRTFTEKTPWQLHYAMGYLIADPGIYCTLTLTNQTAYALFKYGDAQLRSTFLPRYLEKDETKVWYGATFYTEIQGGSDLGSNRATALKTGDHWQLSSEDKYFASNAGIADGALVTARPEGGSPGAKGLALFFVPATRKDGAPNYTIRRLKEKLGTRAVPTGEVVLRQSEAYLVGEPENGIYQALEVLTLARLANAVGALGIARKAYIEALLYSQQRSAFARPIYSHPLVQKDLLEMEVELEANLLLAFKAVQVFNDSWLEKPPYAENYYFSRFLTHLVKNQTAEMSAYVTRMAMELHGGIGFLEDFPIARWHREALITPIWEGGSNIQALDMLETIMRKQIHEKLLMQIEKMSVTFENRDAAARLSRTLDHLRMAIQAMLKMKNHDAQYYAKDLLRQLAESAAAALLLDAGYRMADIHGDYRFLKIADVYMRKHLSHQKLPLKLLKSADEIIQISHKVKENP